MKEYVKDLIICLLIACAFITICSPCSFLYIINEWSDANTLLNVGRAMAKGKVLYKEIYDDTIREKKI